MTPEDKGPQTPTYSRRDVLKSVTKYSAAATGATVVAVTASQALAQASSSNDWVCTDYYPWWWCWLFGDRLRDEQNDSDGWSNFPENRNLPDRWEENFNSR